MTLTVPKEKQYISPLNREVPWCGKTLKHPDFDQWKCWHCQENTRIIKDPDVIVWCQRCYNLQFKKHDNSYMQSDDRISIGKDLMDKKAMDTAFKKAALQDKGHRIDKVIEE